MNCIIIHTAWCAMILCFDTHIYLPHREREREREGQRERERRRRRRKGGGLCATSVPIGAALSN